MSPEPFKLIKDSTLQFLFLLANADGFYICSRHALKNGWVAVGVSNAHQSIELYIKAILRLDNKTQKGHDILKLLRSNASKEVYFNEILSDETKKKFLAELSEAYLLHRYGEAGSTSHAIEIIKILDELAFNFRYIYFKNIQYPNNKIFIPKKLKDDFLENNQFFNESLLNHNPLSQIGFPIDMDLPEDFLV